MKREMISLSTKSTQDHVWKFKPVQTPVESQIGDDQPNQSNSGPKSSLESSQMLCSTSAAFAAAARRILGSR
jgi:hypothetical protein